MSPLTLPKKAASLQYRLVRLPAGLLESQVVAKLLADDSSLRLAYEKALGSVDEKAGRLLDDEALTTRGSALRRRSEVLGAAVALEQKAEARKVEAQQTLQSEKDAAAQERTAAQQSRQQGVQEAAQAERAEKERVRRETEAREKAQEQQVEQKAAQRKAQAEKAERSAKARIAAQERADTAAPKAQLQDATDLAKDATQKKSQAARLGQLAEVEAETRRTAREARTNR